MACGGSGGEGGRGVVVIAAAAADRAHRVVVGIDGEGVAVGSEGGRVGGVAGNGYRARILRVAVVPLHKVMACGGSGGKRGRGTVVVAAAAADATHGGIGAAGGYGVAVDGEGGRVGGVVCNCYGARVLCVAVVPLHEVVARGGRGREGGSGVVVIAAAAVDATHLGICTIDREGVAVGREVGSEGDVACYIKGIHTGGGDLGVAFFPSGEVMAGGRSGRSSE